MTCNVSGSSNVANNTSGTRPLLQIPHFFILMDKGIVIELLGIWHILQGFMIVGIEKFIFGFSSMEHSEADVTSLELM